MQLIRVGKNEENNVIKLIAFLYRFFSANINKPTHFSGFIYIEPLITVSNFFISLFNKFAT